MNIKFAALVKAGVVFGALITLTGCHIHARHGYGHHYHRPAVSVHAHVSKPAHLVGALVAGAVIGSAIEHSSHNERHKQSSSNDNFYLSTKNGDCFWVETDENGVQTRTQVDAQYCRN